MKSEMRSSKETIIALRFLYIPLISTFIAFPVSFLTKILFYETHRFASSSFVIIKQFCSKLLYVRWHVYNWKK